MHAPDSILHTGRTPEEYLQVLTQTQSLVLTVPELQGLIFLPNHRVPDPHHVEAIRLSLCCRMVLPSDILVGYLPDSPQSRYLIDGRARVEAAIQANVPLRASVRSYPSLNAMLDYHLVAQDSVRLTRDQLLAIQPDQHAQDVIAFTANNPTHPLALRLESADHVNGSDHLPAISFARVVDWLKLHHLAPEHLGHFSSLYLTEFATPGCSPAFMERGTQQLLIQWFNLLTHDPLVRLHGRRPKTFLRRFAALLADKTNVRAQRRWSALTPALSKQALWSCLRRLVRLWGGISPEAMAVFDAAQARPHGFIASSLCASSLCSSPCPEQVPARVPSIPVPHSDSDSPIAANLPDLDLELTPVEFIDLLSDTPLAPTTPASIEQRQTDPFRPRTEVGFLLQRVLSGEAIRAPSRLVPAIRSGAYARGLSVVARKDADHHLVALAPRPIEPRPVSPDGELETPEALARLHAGGTIKVAHHRRLHALRQAAYHRKLAIHQVKGDSGWTVSLRPPPASLVAA
mgnify:CR=1 FL=1